MSLKWGLRVCVTLGVFLIIGWMAEHIIFLHAHVRTPGYDPETTLAAHAAGLFAGGAAAVLVFIGLLIVDNKRSR
jgi:hypothetical protein